MAVIALLKLRYTKFPQHIHQRNLLKIPAVFKRALKSSRGIRMTPDTGFAQVKTNKNSASGTVMNGQ